LEAQAEIFSSSNTEIFVMPPGAFVGRMRAFVTGGFHFTLGAGRLVADFMPALEV
jgi:hypothetical protein